MAAKKMSAKTGAKPKTTAAAKPAAGASTAKPKFGSPAWNAKYGIGKKKTGAK